MARQDLLDQSGAAARHPDDEHRNRRGLARLLRALHQVVGEHRLDPLEQAEHHRLVIDDPLALQRIAQAELLDGAIVALDIGIGLGQGEVQRDLVVAGKSAGIGC